MWAQPAKTAAELEARNILSRAEDQFLEKHKNLGVRKESTMRAVAVTELLGVPKHTEQCNLWGLVVVAPIL